MKLLADYQAEVDALLQDQAGDLIAGIPAPAGTKIGITSEGVEVFASGLAGVSGSRDRAIGHAVAQYSKTRPRIIVVDIVGDGTQTYAKPAGWIEECSAIKAIEFPIGEIPAALLDPQEDYEVYKSPTGEQIRLITEKPKAAESFRVTFNGLHAVTEATGTIGDADFSAVCHLAAAICCHMLANRYSQASDSTIAADAVDHKSKAFEFSQRGEKLEKRYRTMLGIKDETAVLAALAVKDFDVDYPWGEDRLTHPRRWR